MKTCPSCHNTFDDNLRFCQNDGTPLVDETPVAGKPADDEPLEIPDFDPMKTMVASAEEQTDVLSTPPAPSFGDLGSLPTPEPESFRPPPAPDSYMPPPIGQPEHQPIPSPPQPPPFAEPEQIYQPPPSPFDSPFSTPPAHQMGASPEWNPPPAPVGQYRGTGQSQTLAIIAMVCGILSIPGLCCWVGILLGPAGAIMGFIAKNKADADPQHYTGRGMAIAGIITGVVGTLLEIGIIILYILGIALNGLGGRGGPF